MKNRFQLPYIEVWAIAAMLLVLVANATANEQNLAASEPSEENVEVDCSDPSILSIQLQEQCEQQELAEKAATRQAVGIITHAIAGGICGVACFNEAWAGACGIGSLAASGIDIGMVIAQGEDGAQAAHGLMGLTIGAATLKSSLNAADAVTTVTTIEWSEAIDKSLPMSAENSQTQSETTTTTEGEGDLASCVKSVLEFGQSYMAYDGMMKSKEIADGSLRNQQSLFRPPEQQNSFGEAGPPKRSSEAANKGSGAMPSEKGSEAIEQQIASCTAGGTASLMECAAAEGIDVTPLARKDLQDAFQQSSGVDMDSFIKSIPNDFTAKQLAAGATGNLKDQSGVLDGANKAAEYIANNPSVDHKLNGTSYAGGGRAIAKSKSRTDQLAGVLEKMFGTLGAKDKKEKKKSTINELDFGKMKPDDIVNNREISLFDRITARYVNTKPRLARLPYSAWQNKRQGRELATPQTKKSRQ